MREEAPRPQETVEVSFEEWKERVQPMAELYVVNQATMYAVKKREMD